MIPTRLNHVHRVVGALALAVTLAACSTDRATAPSNDAPLSSATPDQSNAGGNKFLTVMTRNLYLGADLNPVIGAPSPQLIPIRVAATWAQVQQTNFPERAKALAEEIAVVQPDMIGLQEVSLWRTQFPGDAHLPDGVPATEVAYDFLALILAALDGRHMQYDVVASIDNFEGELFMFTGTPGASLTKDIRLTDRDVILVKHNIQTFNSQAANYAAMITLSVGGPSGPPVTIKRGWTSVDAKFKGETFRFFNTHLEVGSAPFGPVQVAQANEAIALLNASPIPVVAVGDYNSPADGSGTTSYGSITAGGYTDVWNQTNPGVLGYSAGISSDLLGPVSALNERIDLVLLRGPITAVTSFLVGNKESNRTPSGLMPSDHAGLAATVRLGVH